MLYKLLSRMDRARFDPLVVSLADNGSLAVRIAALNIPVFSCGMQPGFPSLPAAFRLTRLLRGFAPHLLQGWMYHGNLAAQAAAVTLAEKTPVVWNIRGSHHLLREEKFMTAATIWIGARLSASPSSIVANSVVSAELHQKHLGFSKHRWAIIPNGFELEKFTPSENARSEVRSELGLPPDTLLIGLIGRYHPVKDHANFLRAAGMFRKDAPGVHFLMAGTGVDSANQALRDQLAALGLARVRAPAGRTGRYVPHHSRSGYCQLFFVFRSVSQRDWRGHVLRRPLCRNRRGRFGLASGRYGLGRAGPGLRRPVSCVERAIRPRRFPAACFRCVGP